MDYQASRKDICVCYYYTTVSGSEHSDDTFKSGSSIALPQYASTSEILEKFPASQFVSFAGLSDKDDYSKLANEETMLSALSRHCRQETAATIYAENGNEAGAASSLQLRDILEQCVMSGQESSSCSSPLQRKAEHIEVAALVNGTERLKNPMTVIDWTSPSPITVEVRRLDANPLFKDDKTYWLCGMPGALGISLCDWMIDRGVRHLVVTSRNPKIERAWLDSHRMNGVHVNVFSW